MVHRVDLPAQRRLHPVRDRLHVAPSENAGRAVAVDARHQRPSRSVLLLTDNGVGVQPRSTSARPPSSAHLSRRWDANRITGRPYHPQTQGKNERVHQNAATLATSPPTRAYTIAQLRSWTTSSTPPTTINDPTRRCRCAPQPKHSPRPARRRPAILSESPPQAPGRASARRRAQAASARNGKILASTTYASCSAANTLPHRRRRPRQRANPLASSTTAASSSAPSYSSPASRYYSNGRPSRDSTLTDQVSTLT